MLNLVNLRNSKKWALFFRERMFRWTSLRPGRVLRLLSDFFVEWAEAVSLVVFDMGDHESAEAFGEAGLDKGTRTRFLFCKLLLTLEELLMVN